MVIFNMFKGPESEYWEQLGLRLLINFASLNTLGNNINLLIPNPGSEMVKYGTINCWNHIATHINTVLLSGSLTERLTPDQGIEWGEAGINHELASGVIEGSVVIDLTH